MAFQKQIVVTAGLILFTLALMAQNKYALLIGINDYYEVPGVKSVESLKGSVNDANAIRNILISKFGFKNTNIDTIYNAAATRDNIAAGLQKKLKQCRPGDIMLFYYSGHGVYMNNTEEANDPVKRGMNQAMLTSDLYNYSDHFKCFFRDVSLKKYFNLFIDKKVILTSVFDCCFSGNLAKADRDAARNMERERSVNLNELMARLTEKSNNIPLLMDSIAGLSVAAVAGCALDENGVVKDKTDSDGDGVPDCKDREKFTLKECMPVDADGVGLCPFDFILQRALDSYDAGEMNKNMAAPPVAATRSFNATEVVTIAEKDNVQRPADRKDSKFLFFSATMDYQKALEFKDSNNNVHGMFTAAIMRAFDKYPADTPMDILFNKVKEDMDGFKKNQTPVMYSDPKRLAGNLIGLPAKRSAK